MQVMTTEDWHALMMSTVRAGEASSYLFFLTWIILSKYVFLMLFLAVAMEAFERSYAAMDHDSPGVNAILSRRSSHSSLYQENQEDLLMAGKVVGDGHAHCSEEKLPAFQGSESPTRSSVMAPMLSELKGTIDVHGREDGAPDTPGRQYSLLTGLLPHTRMSAGHRVKNEHTDVHQREDGDQKSSQCNSTSRVRSATTCGSSRRPSQALVLNLANIDCTKSSRTSERVADAAHDKVSAMHPVNTDLTEPDTSSEDVAEDYSCLVGGDEVQLCPSSQRSSRHSSSAVVTSSTPPPERSQTQRRHSERPARVVGAVGDWTRGRKAHSHTAVNGRIGGLLHPEWVPDTSTPLLPESVSAECLGKLGWLPDAEVDALGVSGEQPAAVDGMHVPHWDEWDSFNAPTIAVFVDRAAQVTSVAATSEAPSVVSTCMEGVDVDQMSHGSADASKLFPGGIWSKSRSSTLATKESHELCDSGRDSSPGTVHGESPTAQVDNCNTTSECTGDLHTRSARQSNTRSANLKVGTGTPEAEFFVLPLEGAVNGSQTADRILLLSVVQRETEVLQLARQLRIQSQQQSLHRSSQGSDSVRIELSFIRSSAGTVAKRSDCEDCATHHGHRQGETARESIGHMQHCTHEQRTEASAQVHLLFVQWSESLAAQCEHCVP